MRRFNSKPAWVSKVVCCCCRRASVWLSSSRSLFLPSCSQAKIGLNIWLSMRLMMPTRWACCWWWSETHFVSRAASMACPQIACIWRLFCSTACPAVRRLMIVTGIWVICSSGTPANTSWLSRLSQRRLCQSATCAFCELSQLSTMNNCFAV